MEYMDDTNEAGLANTPGMEPCLLIWHRPTTMMLVAPQLCRTSSADSPRCSWTVSTGIQAAFPNDIMVVGHDGISDRRSVT